MKIKVTVRLDTSKNPYTKDLTLKEIEERLRADFPVDEGASLVVEEDKEIPNLCSDFSVSGDTRCPREFGLHCGIAPCMLLNGNRLFGKI